MEKLRRWIAFICVLSIYTSCFAGVSALDYDDAVQMGIDGVDSERIENAVVDVTCFTDEALSYVEQYVKLDSAEQYYISDSATLELLLTEEQFLLVQEQISVCNNYGGMAMFASEGSEKIHTHLVIMLPKMLLVLNLGLSVRPPALRIL